MTYDIDRCSHDAIHCPAREILMAYLKCRRVLAVTETLDEPRDENEKQIPDRVIGYH